MSFASRLTHFLLSEPFSVTTRRPPSYIGAKGGEYALRHLRVRTALSRHRVRRKHRGRKTAHAPLRRSRGRADRHHDLLLSKLRHDAQQGDRRSRRWHRENGNASPRTPRARHRRARRLSRHGRQDLLERELPQLHPRPEKIPAREHRRGGDRHPQLRAHRARAAHRVRQDAHRAHSAG